MENLIVGIVGVILLLILMLFGTPIGIALGVIGVLGYGLVMSYPAALSLLGILPFGSLSVFAYMTIPLFIMMGSFIDIAEISDDLFKSANVWLGRLRGGLVMATLVASAFFSAASGSTLANAAVFSKIAIPPMVNAGVDKKLAAGAVAAGGTVDAMIPPSIIMVIYCIITNVSLGKMLIAGIIPGFLTILLFMVTVYIRILINPKLAPLQPYNSTTNWGVRFRSLKGLWGIIVLFLVVMGGIYFGVVTPTEGGGIGAIGALLFAMGSKKLTFGKFSAALLDAGRVTTQIFIIILGGLLFARFMSITGIATLIMDWVLSLGLNRYLIVGAMVVLYAILGCFLDAPSMMIITLPFVFPIIKNLGFDGVWFGIIVTMCTELGLITPPLGLNVYVVRSVSPVPLTMEEVFQGIGWFVVADFVMLIILIAFPQISLWLPSLMD